MVVVWFKRDLRIADHAALIQAQQQAQRADEPLVGLYCIEPELLIGADGALRHYQCVYPALCWLQRQLAARNINLLIETNSALTALARLHQVRGISALFSHQETSNALGFARDQAVGRWVSAQSIRWEQPLQAFVQRNLRTRNNWAQHWAAFMAESLWPEPGCMPNENRNVLADRLCVPPRPGLLAQQLGLATRLGVFTPRSPLWQIAPPDALHLLHSFLYHRGRDYRRAMSYPAKAVNQCSRLSAPLAVGSLSNRQVYQYAQQARYEHQQAGRGYWVKSIDSFISRLAWREHFTQKLEQWPQIEYQPMHSATEGLRPAQPDHPHLIAWQQGQTGWPLVDACMRCLQQTGWLPFRMRAMLVSIITFPLFQDWRLAGKHLARLFADYEPGIHYPQLQMQSGTTGINALRVYDPTKQAQRLDADGAFIRDFLPELRTVPSSFIHQPWRMPTAMQSRCGVLIGQDYPAPLVDFARAARHARSRVAQCYRSDQARAESQQVYAALGSRDKQRRRPRRKPVRAGRGDSHHQLSLF